MKSNTRDEFNNGNEDILSEFLGLVVEIRTRNTGERPIYGRVTKLSKQYIWIERHDGRSVIISRDVINQIQPTRLQPSINYK